MASYTQWAAQAQKGVVKKVSWVCGPERVLCEEVVDFVRTTVNPIDLYQVSAADSKERDIWALVNQYPSDPLQGRLIQVRDAERMKRWDPLQSWLSESRLTPNCYLVLVSNELDFDQERPAHRLLVDKSMTVVRCNHLDQDDAVSWICQRNGCLPDIARYALERCTDDIAAADRAVWKVKLLTGNPTRELLDHMCSPSPSDQFADALIFNRRADALLSLSSVSPDDYSRTIGYLDSRLDVLVKINRAAARGLGPREMSMDRTVSPFLARLLFPAAKIYDRRTVERRRQLLTLVDVHVRDGAREGVMEGLVALW